MKHAILAGNRLFMMHQGDVAVDVEGEEKKALNTDKLMELFEKVNIKDDLSERTLFG